MFLSTLSLNVFLQLDKIPLLLNRQGISLLYLKMVFFIFHTFEVWVCMTMHDSLECPTGILQAC